MITETEMRAKLRAACDAVGGQKIWAQNNNFCISYVTFILSGKRKVSARLAKSLGYDRKVAFIACNPKNGSA